MATGTDDAPPVRAGTRKHEAVARLTDQLSRATSAVVTDNAPKESSTWW